ncbi:hypothetical protein NQD34_013654 [Periophthalmus magnuspinnatus]|nr:hypothetical protein NQD34_013654 [Periophthalmus magnuspinnatus]
MTGPVAALVSLLLVVCGGGRGGVSRAASVGSGQEEIILGPTDLAGVSNLSVFLLDRDSGQLFLGGRDALLFLDTTRPTQAPSKIIWDVPSEKRKSCVAKGKTEADCNNYIRLLEFLGDGRIYMCGTYAFDPQCTFVELSSFSLQRTEDGAVHMETGKGKCPFDPSQPYTAVMAGGTLYTAATSNFLGTLFDISRATGPEENRIRMEQSINWLNDPEFVSSAFIEQSPNNNPRGDDDKIYFFFTEVAKEYELYTKVKVPRVARVCKSDVGGMKTLQRRWTTFLKAQLVCEDKPSGQRYNVLTDVFTTEHVPGDPSSTHFYGLFSSQWEGADVSAVCVFSLLDINKVLDGPFKELKKCDNWNLQPVPTPRPGQCLDSELRAAGFDTSLKLPDKVLTFVRDHPLMENSVTAAPLLVRKGIRYTKLAVSLVHRQGQTRRALLHIGTDRGELHRVAVVAQNATLLQEIPLFNPSEPLNNILLHKDRVVVGGPYSVALLRSEGCGLYHNCQECARARGLGCEWSASESTCAPSSSLPEVGDMIDEALRRCDAHQGRCSPSLTEKRVVLGLQVLLPCVQLSPRPCSWEHPPHRLTRQHHSDLEVTVSEESLGTYICTCQEAGPGVTEPTPCRRVAYQLTLADPTIGGTVAMAGGRHVLAIYILVFVVGVVCGAVVLWFASRRPGSPRRAGPLPDSSLSEKGRELLGSSATPQSPSSTSLFSEGFHLTEKRNGTAPSTTSTTLLSNHGNGTHHGNSCINNGNGNGIYANCNSSSSRLRLGSSLSTTELMDSRTGQGEMSEGGVRKAREGNEEEPALGGACTDSLGGGFTDGLDLDLSLPMFKSTAPLAKCEESSI